MSMMLDNEILTSYPNEEKFLSLSKRTHVGVLSVVISSELQTCVKN